MAKFKLPKKPVDQFTIRFWMIATRFTSLDETRLVFHLNTPFREVLPDYHCEGSPYRNEWAVYHNGICQGRIPGWKIPFEESDYVHRFFSRDEAIEALERRVATEIGRLGEEMKNYGLILKKIQDGEI